MKDPSPTRWVSSIKPGDSLLVLKPTRLWPRDMWYEMPDDRTIVMVTPILKPGDHCGVIDTLADQNDSRVYAALVVSPEGIGCIMAEAEYFRIL